MNEGCLFESYFRHILNINTKIPAVIIPEKKEMQIRDFGIYKFPRLT